MYAINSEILSGNSMRKHFKFGPLNDPWATWQWRVTVALAPRNLSGRVRHFPPAAPQSRVTTTDMDATQGSEASTSLLGPLNGKFIYKKNEDGTINKNAVICSFCRKQFSCHRSCSGLTYHLNAEHVGTSSTVSGASQGASATVSTPRQPTLAEFGERMSKAITEKCICIAFLNNAPGLIGLLGCA